MVPGVISPTSHLVTLDRLAEWFVLKVLDNNHWMNATWNEQASKSHSHTRQPKCCFLPCCCMPGHCTINLLGGW